MALARLGRVCRLFGPALPLLAWGCLEPTPGYLGTGASSTGEGATDGGTESSGDGGSGDTGSSGDSGSTGPETDSSTGTEGGSSATGGSDTTGATGGTTTGTTSGSGSGTGTSTAAHIVFMTSGAVAADFGDLVQADDLCNGFAAAAGLPESFVAVMSDSSTAARDRIAITGPVETMVGELVATDAADLWDGAIAAAVGYNEWGEPQPGVAGAWTGTAADGTAVESCLDWTSASNQEFGMVGSVDSVDGAWIEGYTNRCHLMHQLYCISQ